MNKHNGRSKDFYTFNKNKLIDLQVAKQIRNVDG